MLILSRKVVRLGYLTLCVMSALVMGLVLWEMFHSTGESRDAHEGPMYDIYGANYRHKGKGYHSEQSPKYSGETIKSDNQKDLNFGEDNSWLGVVLGDDRSDTEDQHVFREYPVVTGLASKEFPELPESFLEDTRELDGAAVNPVGDLAVDLSESEGTSKDFHYPEVGYRYQGVFHGEQSIPESKLMPQQAAVIGKPEVRNSSSVHKEIVVHSEENPAKKPRNKKSMFSGALPPPLSYSQMQGQLHTRYLVYLCDSYSMCGGWGDRQRGMVSVYLLSRLIDRQFRIIMSTPCDLSYFYVPKKVQWLPIMDELVTDSNTTINAISNKKFQYNIMEGDFNKRFPQKVVYIKTNQDYYERIKKNSFYSNILDQWSGLNSKPTRFRWAWSELMHPSAMLLTHLEHIVGTEFLMSKELIPKLSQNEIKFISNPTHNIGNSSLICAHVRMGKNPTIPMDEDFPSFRLEDLPLLYNFMLSKDLGENAMFFVATDDENIREQSRAFFGGKLVDYGGKILHIDRQRGHQSACVGFEVALMDQLILSLCDLLIVSRSGFSIHASYLSNSTRPVYIMEEGVIDKFQG